MRDDMGDGTLTRAPGVALVLGLAWFGVTGCGEGATGLESGRTSVVLGQTGDGSATALAAAAMPSEVGLAGVSLDQVSSIVVQVHRVQVHRPEPEDDGDDAGGPAWIDLSVETQEIDLISDLADGRTITLAEGQLEAGQYDQLRLFVEGATITFSEPQPVPGAGDETITEASLRIPSADQTGIKIPGASFTVEGDATTSVEVQFDAGTSVQNVSITGTSEVIMAPVLVGEEGTTGTQEEAGA